MSYKPTIEAKLPPVTLSDVKQYLGVIINQSELENLKLKVKILKCLELAIPQREISKKLKCSVTTVNKINKLNKLTY